MPYKVSVVIEQEAESLLLKAGFILARAKGSHRIYI